MNPDFAVMIDCYKIVTWLDERKKLDKSWQTFQKAAEAKIRLLLDDPNIKKEMPPAIDSYIQNHADSSNVLMKILPIQTYFGCAVSSRNQLWLMQEAS